jgi:hypothetical protein
MLRMNVNAGVLLAASALSIVAANLAYSDCADNGPIMAGCGEGANACVGANQAACQADESKGLGSGLFACGYAVNEFNCRNGTDSVNEMDVCWVETKCKWVPNGMPQCVQDWANADYFWNWVKVSDWCAP